MVRSLLCGYRGPELNMRFFFRWTKGLECPESLLLEALWLSAVELEKQEAELLPARCVLFNTHTV